MRATVLEVAIREVLAEDCDAAAREAMHGDHRVNPGRCVRIGGLIGDAIYGLHQARIYVRCQEGSIVAVVPARQRQPIRTHSKFGHATPH